MTIALTDDQIEILKRGYGVIAPCLAAVERGIAEAKFTKDYSQDLLRFEKISTALERVVRNEERSIEEEEVIAVFRPWTSDEQDALHYKMAYDALAINQAKADDDPTKLSIANDLQMERLSHHRVMSDLGMCNSWVLEILDALGMKQTVLAKAKNEAGQKAER